MGARIVQNATLCAVKGRMAQKIIVIGGGLAGCEAAYQLAERGLSVRLFEMKPHKRTPAQTTDHLAELVCSNSFRGASLGNAVGLLKEELRRAGSFMLRCADASAVPAGGALAVDRERFAQMVTDSIARHPRIELVHEEVTRVPSGEQVIIATGPLTSEALTASLVEIIGQKHLAYYDAIAPIVSADSIQWAKVWKQSRYGKNAQAPSDNGQGEGCKTDESALGDEAYVNCPFNQEQYNTFVKALVQAEKTQPREFEDTRYFEGCLPCEVMAERGERTLAFGPMKPVGLIDPSTNRRPYAVVQLRPEDQAATAYNLVGFQTRMKHADQLRVFRMIPGLEEAEFLRLGSVHRNTFVNAPEVLDETMQLRVREGVYLAGQLSGVEGYVESIAGGFLCAVMLAQKLAGHDVCPPPATTALGGILTHLARTQPTYQPSNITWAHLPALAGGEARLRKRERYDALARRALVDVVAWISSIFPHVADAT